MDDRLTKGANVFVLTRQSREIEECKIEKISKQWVFVYSNREKDVYRFDIETLRHFNGHHLPLYLLFFSKKEVIEFVEYEAIKAVIQNVFAWDSKVHLTLGQLHRINKIIREAKTEHD